MILEPPDRQRGFKKERILRVLLYAPDRELSKYRIAQLTDASEPWVHEYLGRLEDRNLVEGTYVQDISALFQEWRDVRIEPTEFSVSFQKPLQLLEEEGLEYALTTYEAEKRFSGHLFSKTTEFYIHPEDREAWREIVEENGLMGGGNTNILVTDPHVFYEKQRVGGYTLVCIPQLIVDLLREGGPAVEAATILAEKYYQTEIDFERGLK